MISSGTTWNDSKGEAIKLQCKGWQPHLPNQMDLLVRVVLLAMEPLGCGSLLEVHHWGQALRVYSLILLSVCYLCSILNMWSLSLLLWQPAIIYSKVRDHTNPRKSGMSLVPGVFSLLLSRPCVQSDSYWSPSRCECYYYTLRDNFIVMYHRHHNWVELLFPPYPFGSLPSTYHERESSERLSGQIQLGWPSLVFEVNDAFSNRDSSPASERQLRATTIAYTILNLSDSLELDMLWSLRGALF